jgi:hypothetical protein
MREFTKQFSQPVDVTALLDALDVEYIVVNDSRLVVIFRGEVMQLSTENGVENARSIHGTVDETPLSSTDDWDVLVEAFLQALDQSADRST